MMSRLNQALLPMKAHYFLFNAGTGPVVPFLSVYARSLGFSSVVVGLIYTILPISGMIAKPLFGAIADRFHCQKKIFLLSQLITAAFFLAIFYVPKAPLETKADFACTDGESVFNSMSYLTIDQKLLDRIRHKNTLTTCKLQCPMKTEDWPIICKDWNLTSSCSNVTSKITFHAHVPLDATLQFKETVVFRVPNVTFNSSILVPSCASGSVRSTCDIDCDDKDVNNLLTKPEMTDAEAYGSYHFWMFLLFMVAAWVGQALVVSIGDTICFELLGENHHRYGHQRCFGALGWGILSLVTGVLIDAVSKNKSYVDYTCAFYLGSAFLVVDFFVSSTIKYRQSKMSTSILKDVGKLLLNIRIIVFLLWCISVGMLTGLIWNFLLWLVEDLAEAQNTENIKTLQGVIMGVQCLGGELPFFFLSGKILKRIGHINAMSVVLLTLGLRFIAYSYIQNPWWFIPIEFSNGLTFGLFYACMASYASIVAPPGTEATVQGMVGAVFEGVGVSLGSFLGGLAMNFVQGPLTFRYFGIGSILACFLHFIVQMMLKQKESTAKYVVRRDSVKLKDDDEKELTPLKPFISR